MDYNCIICDKEIKQLHESLGDQPDYNGCFDDGIVDKISAGFGSLLDGNMYVIAICDKCIDSKCKAGKAKYVGDYLMPNNDLKDYIGLKEN